MADNKMNEILNYLKNRTEQYPPTVRGIASAIGMSVEPAHHMLTVLRDHGYITWEPKMITTIRLMRLAEQKSVFQSSSRARTTDGRTNPLSIILTQRTMPWYDIFPPMEGGLQTKRSENYQKETC